MYFAFKNENRIMKPVEIILREEGRQVIMMEGVNLIKIYDKHICKYYNVSPILCTTIIDNKK
jgi:hypothetical protein